jgi:large conductance mechanosensitive channel
MSGFKNFLLRGNLVEVAVAFIMATSFAVVVSSFTDMLMAFVGKIFGAKNVGVMKIADVDVAPFINAVIAFVLLAAVVYFLVVVPYTKAKERFFPEEAAGPSELELLTQIRDSLATRA